MPLLTLLLVGVLSAPNPVSMQDSEDKETSLFAFVDVAVVSMQGEQVLEGQTVLVEGERIRSIDATGTLIVPEGATVIDGSGRTLIPGLADMHVHVDVPWDDAPLFLDAGITTVLSLGTSSPSFDAALSLRERSRTPGFMGPTLFTVGPMIQGGEGPDEAERLVRQNAEFGFDLFKIHGDVSAEAFDRLQETARQVGIRVTGHAQRKRGMGPAYEHGQDVAHIEEFLYAAFNPPTAGYELAVAGSLLALMLFSFTSMGWGLSALWRRLRKRSSSGGPTPETLAFRKWGGRFTLLSWLLTAGLAMLLPEPLPGLFSGSAVGVAIVGALMLVVPATAVVLTKRARGAWREPASTLAQRAFLLVLVACAWTHVAGSAFLLPRSWRGTEYGLERIAAEAKAADIWVTPNLVVLDYNERQNTDEFHQLIERPGMRYLTPERRSRWIHNNMYRKPEWMRPWQATLWQSWNRLVSRLTLELHEAGVPLLAATDAIGPHGVLPGSSMHEELELLVQAGLTPYEALRTATVNAGIYMNAETEFGQIASGYLANLVLLDGNPLDDIRNTRTRVGVMKRGRWFPASELDAALERLADDRQ
jgi:hypothetical protein